MDLPLITEVGNYRALLSPCSHQHIRPGVPVGAGSNVSPIPCSAAVVQLQATHDFYRNVYADPDLGPIMKVGWLMGCCWALHAALCTACDSDLIQLKLPPGHPLAASMQSKPTAHVLEPGPYSQSSDCTG